MPARKKKPVRPIKVELDETSPAILASAIVEIERGARKLLEGPLTRKALILLIQENCRAVSTPGNRREARPTKPQIDAMLDSISSLGKKWVRK